MPPNPCGQHETLTSRLNGLLRDYPRGIGILKEFLQNADDAGACRVEVIVDWRNHKVEGVPERMRPLVGPGLLIYNDEVFSDDDLKSIQNIGESVKRLEALKTGRFGLGFNASYNVTDCPAFVTRDVAYFFDPNCHYVPGASKAEPGAWWTLAELWVEHPGLLRPFGVFGLNDGDNYFDGTVFRLPFRTPEEAARSEISDEPFDEAAFTHVFDLIREAGPAILLFLKHVLELVILEVRDSSLAPTTLLRIVTGNADEVGTARAAVNGALAEGYERLVERLADEEEVEVSYRHAVTVEERGKPRLVHTWHVVSGLYRGHEGALLEAMEGMREHNEKAVPWAGVAALVSDIGPPQAVEGRVFCSLPLPEKTGLPVHVNGFFDLDSSRQHVFTGTDTSGFATSRAEWNQLLVENAIARAYARLLVDVAGDVDEIGFASYYELWPVLESTSGALFKLPQEVYAWAWKDDVVLCRTGEKNTLLPYQEAMHLPLGWERIWAPLVAEGFPLPSPPVPDHIHVGFAVNRIDRKEVQPADVRDHLRMSDVEPRPLAEAERACLRRREWVETLLAFCLSDGEGPEMQGVLLGLREDALIEPFGDPSSLYFGQREDVSLLAHSPEWLFDSRLAETVGLDRRDRSTHEAFNLFNVSALAPEQFVQVVMDICLHEEAVGLWCAEGEDVPNEPWVLELIDRIVSFWATRGLKSEQLRNLPFIPVNSGMLVAPGGANAPLVPRQNTSGALITALTGIGIPIVDGGRELLESVRRLASTVPGCFREVEPLAIVDDLVRFRGSWEGELPAEPAASVLDFLSSLTVLPTLRADEARLSALAGLQLFPTADGELVAATDPGTFVPKAEDLPEVAGNVRLFETGPTQRWRPLLQALNAKALDLGTIITDVLLPGYPELDAHPQKEALRWIRDNLERAVSELAARGDDGEWLVEAVAHAEVVRTIDGNFAAPVALYDPREERIVREVLGEHAHFPDMDWYSPDIKAWQRFFEDLGMSGSPRPNDILAYVDGLVTEASTSGARSVADRAMAVFVHVSSRWDDLADQGVEEGGTLAEALTRRAWLPAKHGDEGANFPMFKEPEDRLFRPCELYPSSVAHLVASQHPILHKTDPRSEVTKGLQFPGQPQLKDVMAHFDALLRGRASEERTFTEAQFLKSLYGIYHFFGRFYQDEVSRSQLQARFAARDCLWHPKEKRLFRPDQTFALKQAQIMEPFRAVVRLDDMHDRGYIALGRRPSVSAYDVADYLQDLVRLHGGERLDDEGESRVLKAFRLIQVLLDEQSESQVGDLRGLPVLTLDKRLMPAGRVFFPDALDVKRQSMLEGIGLLHDGIPAKLAEAVGVRSLNASLNRDPVGERVGSLNPEFRKEVERLQGVVRSVEFREGLRRLIQHEHGPGFFREADVRWLSRLILVAVERLEVQLTVEVEGAPVELGVGTSDALFQGDDTMYLAEGHVRRAPNWLASALNQELAPSQRLTDTSGLVEVLRVGPEEISTVLDQLRLGLLRDEELFERLVDIGEEGDVDVTRLSLDASAGAAEVAESDEDVEREYDFEGLGSSVPRDAMDGGDGAELLDSGEDGIGVPRETTDSFRPPDSSQGIRPPGTSGRGPGSGAEGGTGRPVSATLGVGTRMPSGGTGTDPGRYDPRWASRTSGKSSRRGSVGQGGRGGRRVVSMVCYAYEEHAHYDCHDFDDSGNERNLRISGAAVQRVLQHETQRGWLAEGKHFFNPGFDVESTDPDSGEVRHIEVKGIAGAWGERGVPLSRRQFEFGRENPDSFWLYVVEYAEDPERAIVWPIEDPVRSVDQFRFDHRWRAMAVESTNGERRLEPRTGLRLRYEGIILDIKGVRRRGRLTQVHVEDDEGVKAWKVYQPDKMEILPARRSEVDGETGGISHTTEE